MAMDEDGVSDDEFDASDPDGEEENVLLHEAVSPDAERLREIGSAGEALTRVELDLAYSSEKLSNLETLLMQVATSESDYEALAMENEESLDDSVEKGLEFDLLSGILDSEVREMEQLMASLQPDIVDAHEKISSCEHLTEDFSEMEEKLYDSEEALKQSLNQLAEIRMQCDKFQRTLLASGGQANWNNDKDADNSENGQFSRDNAKIKMQTAEQQRDILRLLEKSLARELDLEKKLSDSRQSEEVLNSNLHSTQQEILFMDEAAEDVFSRLFEAENAAEVLRGISKEIMGRLQVIQFNLNGSISREEEMRSKLQDLMNPMRTKENALQTHETSSSETDDLETLKTKLKEAEDKYADASSEAFTLRERVQSLEVQLKECDIQLQNTKVFLEEKKQPDISSPELNEMKTIIEDLKANMLKAENKVEKAEAKCSLLEETNLVLTEELDLLKSIDNGIEKVNLLEKQLRDSDMQLQQAKASVEANQEQQKMLYSAIKDMENLINDLKSKVLKAESRAEKSDAKCAFLSETNLELNEELSFLRLRMECLEKSLCQADEEKIATAKEINKRAKVITDLVLQLALERERLHEQISSLTKENKVLVAKFWKSSNKDEKENFGKVDSATDIGTKESEEGLTEFSATNFQVDKSEIDAPIGVTEVEPNVIAEAAVGESNLESARRIEATQLNSKYLLMPIVILLISAIAVYLIQPERYRF